MLTIKVMLCTRSWYNYWADGDLYANDLVHCVYECPSIMDSVELDYSKYEDGAIVVAPRVGFDWYVTGYCISHFDVRWGLIIGNCN